RHHYPHHLHSFPTRRSSDLNPKSKIQNLNVLSQGQGIFDDQSQIASILGWDKDRVRVDLVQNGGAFGGKEDMSIQGQTALAAALDRKSTRLNSSHVSISYAV